MLSLIYLALRRMLALNLLRCRSQEFKELEIVVLRHELEILRRQTRRPELRSADRAFLAAASRLLPPKRWRSLFVSPTRFCAGIASSWRSAGRTRDGAQAARGWGARSASLFCASLARTRAGAISGSRW